MPHQKTGLVPFLLEVSKLQRTVLLTAEPSEAKARPTPSLRKDQVPPVSAAPHTSGGAQDDRTGRKQTWG